MNTRTLRFGIFQLTESRRNKTKRDISKVKHLRPNLSKFCHKTAKHPIDSAQFTLSTLCVMMMCHKIVGRVSMITKHCEKIRAVLQRQGCQESTIELFLALLRRYYQRLESPKLDWHQVHSPDVSCIENQATLPDPSEGTYSALLSKLAVCKLNGGLGTSMGCVGPKSIIEVRDEKTFLDLTVMQIQAINARYNANVPLILMNSIHTHKDTQYIIEKYASTPNILSFEQSTCLRLRSDTLQPLTQEAYGHDALYPPGHGDFYASFQASGLLDKMLAAGKSYVFVSNIDNLGATVDLKILQYLETSNAPFVMEVTPKTIADVKGGTLVTLDEHIRLLEIAQVPKEHTRDFMNVRKFEVFNTNNIWINLHALKAKLAQGPLELDLIVNHKKVGNLPVIQLETAMGSAISQFPDSKAILVDRNRFLPVKTTSDLLLVQSNLFLLDAGNIIRNPDRHFDHLPLISLGQDFQTVEQYQERIPHIPDILDLHALTIIGNVYLGKDITLAGNVIINCEREALHIPNVSHLYDQFLTGSLKTEAL